ncbi:MurR/RpiR family transcriptional regulator [Pseudotabrizicola alkalilacus]|uniref:MurR/RpiR family transcriptional regulator n=1 Tax=Pseudotabrizicola alkalilacus TaxID=2305252 RepID=A0A411YY03_9RHOB|nr:MurR/RpiR family transcriptional regulator [Pseudotabrizicola alkalilacus]RGP35736.1 MurR/RpiR family transcriptional regulator [Pseudotabrizicola alkalilacus]
MREATREPDETALAARLRSMQADLTKSEAMIAQWFLLNEATLALETGTSIAAKTGVSEITVSRFLRRIGFRGMAELKAEIGSPAAKLHIHAADRYIRLLEGELGTLLRRDADAILSLGTQISRSEWEAAVTVIDEADEVFVTGFQTVRGLAEDFARRLGIVRGSVRFLSAHDGGLVEWVPSRRRVDEKRTLVLVDMVPYAREAETVVRTARGLGIEVVVITDELNTWAQVHTPFVFHASTKAGAFLESTGPLATLLNLVTHAVAGRDPDKARQRISAWPAVLRDLGLY